MGEKKDRHRGTGYRLAEAVSRFTELPVEALCNLPLFYIKGREEVEITGCRGILSYDEGKVIVKTCGIPCTVMGAGLILSDFHNDVLVVRGRIDGVLLTEETGDCLEEADCK